MSIPRPDFSAVPEALRGGVENHWDRFVENVTRRAPDIADELFELCAGRDDIARVWACSDFVAGVCVVQPELLYDMLRGGEFDQLPPETENRLREFVGECADEQALNAALRRFRKREMVAIAWRDLCGLGNLAETLRRVSALADAAIRVALDHHQRWLVERFGEPRDADGAESRMVVLGLGKLGGRELNYSSDIDLIFAFSRAGQTSGGQGGSGRSLDNQEFFTRLGRKLIAALDPVTPDGFVFRTDMRLRPNGDSGPLVLSFAATEHYYQVHGRDWERYAMIKARVVAGADEDGAELLATLTPFVYRKYLDFSAYESIRDMKERISHELMQEGMANNIKLGRGGIREIEFFVQSHQLTRGGREKGLRTQSLYGAMQVLVSLRMVRSRAREALIDAYTFLRNTEHRLQMVADRQTQMLPSSDEELFRLAWSMGCDDQAAFMAELNAHRDVVHEEFQQLLGLETGEQDESAPDLGSAWQASEDADHAEQVGETLQRAGFADTGNVVSILRGFRAGRLYQSFSGVERDRLDRLMPMVLEQAVMLPDPERAVAAFVSVVEAIGRRSVYISLLLENPAALEQLLHLCGASPWVSRHIGQNPAILDELLQPMEDIREIECEHLAEELGRRLSQFDPADEESRMDVTREFQHGRVLQVAAADVTGVLRVEDVHLALTRVAEALVGHVLGEALGFVRGRHGDPPGEAGVIAYGKFASGELGYNSDLDVVLCYEYGGDGGDTVGAGEAEHFYSRVARRLIHLLTARTSAGILYEIDMRLRPSGRSGTVVTSLDGFFGYQRREAWTWEHQALVRARVVGASEDFVSKFEDGRRQILCLERDDHKLGEDIREMRRKMIDANCRSDEKVYDIKLGEGGIVDIEFLVQYWILRHAHAHPQLAEARTTPDCIAALVERGLVEAAAGERLAACYRAYLRRSLDMKLLDRPVLVDQEELREERDAVHAVWAETLG